MEERQLDGRPQVPLLALCEDRMILCWWPGHLGGRCLFTLTHFCLKNPQPVEELNPNLPGVQVFISWFSFLSKNLPGLLQTSISDQPSREGNRGRGSRLARERLRCGGFSEYTPSCHTPVPSRRIPLCGPGTFHVFNRRCSRKAKGLMPNQTCSETF